MITTIIAEKPSVAYAIAQIANATIRHDGYFSNEENTINITWALGHLIQLAMPQEYGYERNKPETLPYIPEPFRLIRRQMKTKEGYKTDENAAKQLEIIRQLFNNSDRIVCATDAGREGELIFRYIYEHLSCHKPFKRLWTNSLTDKAIREGMNNLKDGNLYDNLYFAAKARSESDWLIGINASQALSIAAGKNAFSLGRVQTPTLSMICSRYMENKNFKPTPYWQLKLQSEKYNVQFSCLSERYSKQQTALQNLENINLSRQISVTGHEKKEIQQTPPLPYDLTTLQKDANIKFNFSADKTLFIAQQLYEAKLITYPRTGSRYLPEDVFEEIPKLLENLEQYPVFSQQVIALKGRKLNRKAVDNSKVTDHHALIITDTHIPKIMAEDETRIFNLIAGRMLETLSSNCTKEIINIQLETAGIPFQVKGNSIKEKGWRAVFDTPEKQEDEDENVILPVVEKGEVLSLKNIEIVEKQTKPQALFSEATLLEKMETAGKDLTSEEEREALKNCGLGTPATRASIIEVLFRREYIRKEKKSLIPTAKGLAVYHIVRNMKIADVQMTGDWENVLANIEQGKNDAITFHKNIIELTRQITRELLSAKINIQDANPHCLCPKCKKSNLLFYNKVVKCPDDKCGLVLFKNKGDKQISDNQIIELVTKGKTPIIKGFKNKDKKNFDAALILNENFKMRYQFPPKKKKS